MWFTLKWNAFIPCFPPGKRAVVGYEDGSVRVWDLKQGNTIHVIKGKAVVSSYCQSSKTLIEKEGK